MSFKSLAKISIILSVALLFVKTTFTGWFRPDVFLIIIATIAVIISWLNKELAVPWKKLRPIILTLIILIASILLGSLVSYIKFSAIPLKHILIEWRILTGCVLIFTEIILLGQGDKKFLEFVLYSFLMSLSIVLTPYFPNQFMHHVLEGSNRFGGFISSSNFYPTLMILPTILIFHLLIIKKIFTKNFWLKVVSFLVLSLSIGLIIWSGSRSGWLGLITGLSSYLIVSTINTPQKRIGHFMILVLVLGLAGVLSLMLIPQNGRVDIINRITYITTQPPPVISADTSEKLLTTIPIIDHISHSQDRLSIWRNSIPFIISNPLGYGLAYGDIINIRSETGEHSGVHSFPLELILTGGLLSIISVTYLLWKCSVSFIKFQIKNRVNDLELVVLTSLIGLLVCVLFLSSLLIRWLWVEFAILIAWQMNRESFIESPLDNR